MNTVTHIKPVQKVEASYRKANEVLGYAQKVANQTIQQFLKSDLSYEYNTEQLAKARAELAGIRKLQAMAMILQG